MYNIVKREVDKKLYNKHYKILKDPYLASILASRGIKKLPTYRSKLQSPFDFKEMRYLVKYLDNKIRYRDSEIIVNCDYDNDGFSGGLIFISFIKKKYGKTLDLYINRRSEGYELTKDIVDRFYNSGKRTIIMIDKGISSYDACEYAKSLGMDVIVIDHHQPKIDNDGKKIRPNANFVICHTLEEDVGQLCGAATSWYLCRAIDEKLAKPYVDIAGIATIVDMVSLSDEENRKIVLKALHNIRKNRFSIDSYKLLVESLIHKDIKEINSSDFGFIIGPSINSLCRYDRAEEFCRYIIDEQLTPHLIEEIIKINSGRKERVSECVKEIKLDVKESDNFIICKTDRVEHSLLGLIASKFMNEYNKTTFVMQESDGYITCSARSIGFDLQKIFKYDIDINGGGHQNAVGFTMKSEDYDKFIDIIEKDITFEPLYHIDFLIDDMNIVNIDFIERLEKLEPYGIDFDKPRFLIDFSKFDIGNITKMKDIHIKIEIEGINLIHFNSDISNIDKNDLKDYISIGTINKNIWGGRKSVQFIIDRVIRKDKCRFLL